MTQIYITHDDHIEAIQQFYDKDLDYIINQCVKGVESYPKIKNINLDNTITNTTHYIIVTHIEIDDNDLDKDITIVYGEFIGDEYYCYDLDDYISVEASELTPVKIRDIVSFKVNLSDSVSEKLDLSDSVSEKLDLSDSVSEKVNLEGKSLYKLKRNYVFPNIGELEFDTQVNYKLYGIYESIGDMMISNLNLLNYIRIIRPQLRYTR